MLYFEARLLIEIWSPSGRLGHLAVSTSQSWGHRYTPHLPFFLKSGFWGWNSVPPAWKTPALGFLPIHISIREFLVCLAGKYKPRWTPVHTILESFCRVSQLQMPFLFWDRAKPTSSFSEESFALQVWEAVALGRKNKSGMHIGLMLACLFPGIPSSSTFLTFPVAFLSFHWKSGPWTPSRLRPGCTQPVPKRGSTHSAGFWEAPG